MHASYIAFDIIPRLSNPEHIFQPKYSDFCSSALNHFRSTGFQKSRPRLVRKQPILTNIAHLFLFISLRASRHAFADVGHSPSLSLTQMFQLFPSIREFDFVYIDRPSGIIVYVLPNVVWPLFVPILNGLVS